MKEVELMNKNNEKVSANQARPRAEGDHLPKHDGARLQLTVAQRRRTPEEERQFIAAFDVFLAELVRLNIDRKGRL